MIKKIYSWNQMYKIVMLIKEDYNSTFDDGEKNFETWLEKLNNSVWNDLFSSIQISQDGDFVLLRYGLHDVGEGLWNDSNSIYRECRSIVIDIEKDCLVLAPYRKFFNIGEIEETSLENVVNKIKNAEVFEVANKLDGSMFSATYYLEGERIVGSTSKALSTENSWRLKDCLERLSDNHKALLKDFPYMTYIFEYIDVRDTHLVKYSYEEEGLYLIGGRSKLTGREISYSEVKYLAKAYGIKHVEIEEKTLEEILKESKEIKSNEKEGWVLNVDGTRYKLKGDDYVNLHRLLSFVSSPNVIIESIAENMFDDLYSKVPETHKERVLYIAKALWKKEKSIRKQAKELCKEMKKFTNRKDAMIYLQNKEVPEEFKKFKSYAIKEYDEKEYNVFKKRGIGYYNLNELNLDYDEIMTNFSKGVDL